MKLGLRRVILYTLALVYLLLAGGYLIYSEVYTGDHLSDRDYMSKLVEDCRRKLNSQTNAHLSPEERRARQKSCERFAEVMTTDRTKGIVHETQNQ